MIKVRKNGLPIHANVQNTDVMYIYSYYAHTHSGSYTQWVPSIHMHVSCKVRQMLASYMAAFWRAYYKAPFYTRAHACSFGSLYSQPSIRALNYIDYGRYCGPHYWAYYMRKILWIKYGCTFFQPTLLNIIGACCSLKQFYWIENNV